jgi:hypothetical protein
MTNIRHPQVNNAHHSVPLSQLADIRYAISNAVAVAAEFQAGGKPPGLENVRVSDLFSDDAE